MSSFGFVKDAMNNLANNRRMLKGRRERHNLTRDAYLKDQRIKKSAEKERLRPVDQKGLKAVKSRVGRTRTFELWIFSLMALAIVVLVVWLMWA